MTATNIQDVVDGLTAEVRRCQEENDRVGYFASLYRQVTVQIQRDVLAKKFDDNDRMERFDVAFGNRYFTPLQAWKDRSDGMLVTWRDAFGATQRSDLAIVQHLVLGVNAHINVDLAVATMQMADGADLSSLQNDYNRINDILISVLDRIQGVLDDFSPAAAIIDVVGGRLDETILGFSVKRARGEAWDSAVLLAAQPTPTERERLEGLLDSHAQGLGRLVLEAGRVLQWVLPRETATLEVDDVIDRLDHAVP